MAFQKMKRPVYPKRHWSLVGYPGSGKSSFAAKMRGPKLVVDADHRFSEVMGQCEGSVYELSTAAEDNLQPLKISQLLDRNMPGSDVQTIIVDSLTAIITPHVVQAMLEKEQGHNANLMAAFKTKALAMRMLQDSITRWGTDVLWIYHLQDARDAKAAAVVRSSVSQTELARLTRSINLQLQVVMDGARRGIQVTWARRGRAGMTLWDESGQWDGMPERIEEAVYAGLTVEDQDRIAAQKPMVFPNSETAISWGVETGAFKTVEESRRAYERVKREGQPTNAHEMAAMWVAEVQGRSAAAAAEGEEEEEDDVAFDSEPAEGRSRSHAAK